jgi:putative intracellular protease/amidase
MKLKACLLVFDGLADWEPAHALCEINKSGKFEVVTVGLSKKPIVTMAGLKLIPDMTIDDADPAEVAIFILPGGDMWEETPHEALQKLLHRLHTANVTIGALCAATLEIARAGLTRGIHHTSNAQSYLKAKVPGYSDAAFYVDLLAVADRNIITASGLGSVDFAFEVIKHLNLYSPSDARIWFDMFKHGLIPAGIM